MGVIRFREFFEATFPDAVYPALAPPSPLPPVLGRGCCVGLLWSGGGQWVCRGRRSSTTCSSTSTGVPALCNETGANVQQSEKGLHHSPNAFMTAMHSMHSHSGGRASYGGAPIGWGQGQGLGQGIFLLKVCTAEGEGGGLVGP